MMTKIYGVKGLMEWQALIKVGKATLHVPFTGGTLTGYGVTPATFTTSNVFYQKMIEDSDYFRSGKIALLRTLGTEDKPLEAEPAKADGNAEVIKVDGVASARDILVKRYGLAVRNLMTKDKVKEAGKAHGIDFYFE